LNSRPSANKQAASRTSTSGNSEATLFKPSSEPRMTSNLMFFPEVGLVRVFFPQMQHSHLIIPSPSTSAMQRTPYRQWQQVDQADSIHRHLGCLATWNNLRCASINSLADGKRPILHSTGCSVAFSLNRPIW
jgi:hypothetical protein